MKKHSFFVYALLAFTLFATACAKAEITSITNTYWRDDSTGDWFIGFAEKHVIYESRVFDIAQQTETDSCVSLTLCDGRKITVSKTKTEQRQISVDGGTTVLCSQITTPSLPDYPTKDTRKGFVDNDYRENDSVTIVGWLKDMPRKFWRISGEFELTYHNIIRDKQESVYTKLKPDGQFTLRFPLLNTTQVFVDWKRTHISTVLEPGKNYFLLFDFKTMQCLFMGDDVRVQNELVSHMLIGPSIGIAKSEQPMDFKKRVEESRVTGMRELDNIISQHPNLSQRYIDYMTGTFLMTQGYSMMQARYSMPQDTPPQEYMDYVEKEIWQKITKPYTLHCDFNTFLRDYLDIQGVALHKYQNKILDNREDILFRDVVHRLEEQGYITLSDADKQTLEQYRVVSRKFKSDMSKAQTEEESNAIVDVFNSNSIVKRVDTLITQWGEPFYNEVDELPCHMLLAALDSIGCDSRLRDICLARAFCSLIDDSRLPMLPILSKFAEREIGLPAAKNTVLDLNEKYLALSQGSDAANLKSSDNVAGMSDGEQILRKIIEPYKGRLILVDFWGVWCPACKEALSHSAEEYKRLEKFDLVYLYLANKSGDVQWKNVIKEYNVLGKNVVHYNLPQDQQSAVEHYLNVSAFPTYLLIDRNGNVLDVNANPNDLDALEKLLKQMK
ncbi:MAG: thioredoxin family protein [Salinivirgaceae bacterium]|nr:thioredoxin family protein [Salinivirgaceae bacterium]